MALSILLAAALLSGAPQSLTVFEARRPPPAVPTRQASSTALSAPPAEVVQVCRNQTITGSRFPIRVCRSQRQTDADRAESRDMLREVQRQRKQEPLI